MFSSLRARLWLSYALLIGILLLVVAGALVISLLRNPLVYRSVLPGLKVVALEVLPQVRQSFKGGLDRVQKVLEKDASGRNGIRTAVLDQQGRVIADSLQDSAGAIPQLNPDTYPSESGNNRPGLLRDAKRRFWVYWTADIGQGYTLLVASPLPRLQIGELLRNEVASPLVWAGGVAFLVAALLAVGMGSWISAPLRRMMAASREMAAGKEVTIQEEGPSEARELARALNEMHRQARAGQQSQQEVLQSQRDFVANVSHELKTPLTSIQGFAQAILDGAVQSPEALHSAAEVIYNESTRMYRLVLDLLTLARLEAGTADLQRNRLDLALLLRNVVAKFAPQAAAARVELLCEVPDLPAMIGDGDRLAQVFTNLVDNALKFTPPDGRVGLRASPVEGGMLVEVWDTGKGIPEADRSRVFERFYQVEKSRRGGAERGVGLGLPIARQIVLAHSGKMWVEGHPGGFSGSRFLVKLPAARPDDATLMVRKN